MKTYSRLQAGRRRLSEYEIVSSGLHYNYPSRFEIADTSPVVRWYRQYREGSRLVVRDWNAFSDPRLTTYRAYTTLQDRGEQVVDGLFDEIDNTDYDRELDEGWVAFLHEHYFPLRFPAHSLEMLAAYVAQMAPSSRITNCAAFQAGDELRRMQRIAYRTAQLAAHRPGYDPAEHRANWEEGSSLQPLRELIERALVRFDWAEAFVLLNVLIKPRLDRWVNHELAAELGHANGDPVLGSVHFSLDQDSQWHRKWTRAALHVAIADNPMNRDLVHGWLVEWQPLADTAVDALVTAAGQAPQPLDAAAIRNRIATAVAADVDAILASPQSG
jgi:toluene monooxygenase system protein E